MKEVYSVVLNDMDVGSHQFSRFKHQSSVESIAQVHGYRSLYILKFVAAVDYDVF